MTDHGNDDVDQFVEAEDHQPEETLETSYALNHQEELGQVNISPKI